MISRKYLGLAALAAAATLAPVALATTPASGSLASCTLTIRQYPGATLTDGLVATTTVDLTGVSSTAYTDGAGRVRKSVDGLGNVSTATYDAAGNLLSRRDATGAGTDYTYDPLGRKLTETDAAITGKVRSYTYDKVDRLLTATDPLGVVTTYGYDLRDRKISESTPMNGTENRVIQYGYNGRGHMTTLTDANGAVTTWGYDAAGRQVSKLYANGDHRTMEYDAVGRIVKLTDENGFDTTSTYDLAGRLTAKHFAADNTDDTFVYDATSRMISVTKGRYADTLTYAYDPAGRLATETHADGTVVHLSYDAANRLANLSLGDGSAYSVAYAFDGRGLLSTVSQGDYASRYEYRANGQLASTINAKLSTPAGDILRADRSYDAGARLLGVANTAANNEQAGVVYTLGLDDQRLTAVEESGQKWDYGYDGLKQLVTAKKTDTAAAVVIPLNQSYGYDPMGNRRTYTEQGKTIAYTANSANQYASVTETINAQPTTSNCQYDHNGNLLTDGVKNYTWDAENQLIAVTPVTATEGAQKVEYTYDWRMRRTAKKSYTYTAGVWNLTKTTGYKYHEWNPIEETITVGTATEKKNYIWGNDLSGNLHGAGGVGGLLSMKYNGDNYFYAFDGNGNVRALVKADGANPAASAITARYAYDGFGKEVVVSGVDVDRNAFRFSTKQLDAETSMNYYGYRFYDANNGRWINRDPIAEDGGVNVYAMIGNDAVMLFDLNGLCYCSVMLKTHASESTAYSNGTQDVSVDFGHTWVEYSDENGNKESWSLGPDWGAGRTVNFQKFLDGNLPSKQWPIPAVTTATMEWGMGKVKCEKALKVIRDLKAKMVNYTALNQCTSSAIKLLGEMQVDPLPPDGKGPMSYTVPADMTFSFLGVKKDYKRGDVISLGEYPNPYKLSEQIGKLKSKKFIEAE